MQVFLGYNFTSPGNLAQGVIQPDLGLVWSRRVNLVSRHSTAAWKAGGWLTRVFAQLL
jgi:hypothetical protein